MPKTMTEKALAANRANAQKSTGPRSPEGKAAVAANAACSTGPSTPEGKAHSRWNALKHGLRARALIPAPLQGQESVAEFAAVHEVLRAEFDPATPFEEMLVEAIAANYWRLGRATGAESHGIVAAQAGRRADLELLTALRAADPLPGAPEPTTLLPEQITLPDDNHVTTLMRYEAHLERQMARAYNLLERVQRRRRAQSST